MKNIDEQIEEVTLHNKWFELTGIEISPEIAVFLRWAFKLIQKEREEAVRGFVDSVVDCVLNNKAPHSVNIFNIALKAKLTAAKTNDIAEVDSFLGLLRGKAEACLSQTKGGKGE